jgi:hypothetical protein
MNNYLYTFKGGNLYRHNVNELRNNFYGVQYSSRIKSVLNDYPMDNKLFKTISLEGDDSWAVALNTDLQYSGVIDAAWFEKKESSYFAFVRNQYPVPADSAEFPLRSVNGIGRSLSVTFPAGQAKVNFSIIPLVQIGSIVSIGDLLYFALPPYDTPQLAGKVIEINVDYKAGINQLIIDTTITDAVPISSQTAYMMYIKNSVAESHGVLGHYCVFDIENDNTEKVELFLVRSEIMKSFP